MSTVHATSPRITAPTGRATSQAVDRTFDRLRRVWLRLMWPRRRRPTAEELLVQLLPHLSGGATRPGTWPTGGVSGRPLR